MTNVTPNFTNIHGHHPSPKAAESFGHPTADQLAKRAARKAAGIPVGRIQNPIVARVGREGIDLAQCQAPIKWIGQTRARCDRPATYVAVENVPRSDGTIAAMSLCDLCTKTMQLARPNYANITPITSNVSVSP